MSIKDYEDVSVYGLDADQEAELLTQQNECTFCWTTRDGSPMAVIMSHVYHRGRFLADGQRKRVPAVRRDGRVAVVIASSATDIGAGRAVSYKDRRGCSTTPRRRNGSIPPTPRGVNK